MKIFTSSQLALIDSYTIINEPVSEADLIKRAAKQLYEWIKPLVSKKEVINIFAGPGNNGNDAIALTSILATRDYLCNLYLINGRSVRSELRKELLNEVYVFGSVNVKFVESESEIPQIPSGSLVVEGIFGTGLNRCAEGIYCPLIDKINTSGAKIISIDMPSGLFSEDNSSADQNKIIRADFTLTFEFPKLCMFFKENAQYVGKWSVLPIGLHKEIVDKTESLLTMLNRDLISSYIKKREKFSHKGDYGHALLIAGSYGMAGAAVLSAKGALRAGAGLLTLHIPRLLYDIIQVSVPEALCSVDKSDEFFTGSDNLQKYDAVAIGPGLGTAPETLTGLKKLFSQYQNPIVIDADALNIIASDADILKELPKNSILTPHPGEFSRLAGYSNSSYEAVMKQSEFSVKNGVIVVLKGAHTSVTTPSGHIYFNSTGNPGMATAGSGDVLTGVILSLLSQGYPPETAALAGVYLHGLAGDLAAEHYGEQSLISGDIPEYLGAAFKQL